MGLGTKRKNDKNIGPHTRVKISSSGNGAMLKQMLQKKRMRAMNTYFKQDEYTNKDKEKLNTWRSISGKQKGQIYYMIIDTHKANWVEKINYKGNANAKTNNGHKAIMM